MYPSADLNSLLTCSSSTNLSPCRSYPPPSMSFKDNQARIVLNEKGTSYAILAASSDRVLFANSVSDLGAVNGSVKLVLGDAQAIHSVVVSILGQIVTRANATKHITFLNISQTLWSRKCDINHPSSLINPPIDANHSQKLSGDHYWPFSISLPKEILLSTRLKHEPEIFRLPESFNERNVRVSIQYSIHLRLMRGKFKADNKLRIALTCPSVASPEFFSFPRQSLSDMLFLLRGPREDPEAWYSYKGMVTGRLNHHHLIDVKYTLSLAKPLWYVRGSVIPFSLVIEANNEDVLDALSSSEAPVLRLRRHVKCDDSSTRFWPTAKNEAIEYSNLAVWWPYLEPRIPKFRQLSGELHLPPDMKPTTAIAHFRIEYSVVLFPFDAVSFKSASGEPLVIVDVEIA